MPRHPFALRRTGRSRVAAAPRADALLRLAALATAALLLLLLTAGRAFALQGPHGDGPPPGAVASPSPELSPEQVVGIVLDALARNDLPTKDHGITVTFAFSSPANRAFVGPIERFAELVHEATYRPLLNNRRASSGALRVDGDRATLRVVVTTAGGERVAYRFALSMQADGPYKGCWMTDGVTREPPSALAAMQIADEL